MVSDLERRLARIEQKTNVIGWAAGVTLGIVVGTVTYYMQMPHTNVWWSVIAGGVAAGAVEWELRQINKRLGD